MRILIIPMSAIQMNWKSSTVEFIIPIHQDSNRNFQYIKIFHILDMLEIPIHLNVYNCNKE